MKNPKGSGAVWAIVILVIVIIAAAAWYFTQNPNQPAAVPVQQNTAATTQPQNTTPSAAIDQSSLSQRVAKNNSGPIITGTAVNATAIEISAWGLLIGSAQVVNGHWSINIANNKAKFVTGSYSVKVFNVSGKDDTYIPSNADLLATGTLVVTQ